jgi:glycosyltransferase involved in cell wall biosynthesis
MNILWSIHLYPPNHNCGSEYVAHNINKFLISKGHQVRVFLHQAEMHKVSVPYNYEGVDVMGGNAIRQCDSYRWADVILTHLDYTQYTILMGYEVKRPLVHFIHNDTPYTSIQTAFRGQHVVYNSQWISDKLAYQWPSTVLTPPCDYDYYNVCENPEENEYITLINLDVNKGGEILREVARAMPDKKFLGVIGSYSTGGKGQIIEQPGNVKVVPNTPDILSIYKQTRVLLMPSEYESWGRTATEAMCSGIPVIACPTPGLKENLGEAGVWIPARKPTKRTDDGEIIEEYEYDITELVNSIKRLDDKEYYKSISVKSRDRAQELRPKLSELEDFLINAKF